MELENNICRSLKKTLSTMPSILLEIDIKSAHVIFLKKKAPTQTLMAALTARATPSGFFCRTTHYKTAISIYKARKPSR